MKYITIIVILSAVISYSDYYPAYKGNSFIKFEEAIKTPNLLNEKWCNFEIVFDTAFVYLPIKDSLQRVSFTTGGNGDNSIYDYYEKLSTKNKSVVVAAVSSAAPKDSIGYLTKYVGKKLKIHGFVTVSHRGENCEMIFVDVASIDGVKIKGAISHSQIEERYLRIVKKRKISNAKEMLKSIATGLAYYKMNKIQFDIDKEVKLIVNGEWASHEALKFGKVNNIQISDENNIFDYLIEPDGTVKAVQNRKDSMLFDVTPISIYPDGKVFGGEF
jgi:hypothetical protein